ncbi:hypothetical protein MarbSA_14560 [Methanobrevibacter arboriphilus]|uniref:Uncharacterized protein n=1 Tax=Methanobrevibacter arboriphilus TaxID=39441 RepID=A0ACA8R509_METAZ|nr:hypothetical protein MarbSA_14560 [Methanobrevibacter arboriphilus]
MNTHNQPCNKEKRINRLETDNIQNKTDIKNIKEDVDCLNNEDKNIKEIVQGLKEAVSTLTGNVNILKWIFGIGLPVLSALLIIIIGLLIKTL